MYCTQDCEWATNMSVTRAYLSGLTDWSQLTNDVLHSSQLILSSFDEQLHLAFCSQPLSIRPKGLGQPSSCFLACF